MQVIIPVRKCGREALKDRSQHLPRVFCVPDPLCGVLCGLATVAHTVLWWTRPRCLHFLRDERYSERQSSFAASIQRVKRNGFFFLFHWPPHLKQVGIRQKQGVGARRRWECLKIDPEPGTRIPLFKRNHPRESPERSMLHSRLRQCTNYHLLHENDPQTQECKRKFSISVSMAQESRGNFAVFCGSRCSRRLKSGHLPKVPCLKRQLGGHTTKSTGGS